MEQKYYSDEKNIQILISLLKQSGIRKIVASPGATNVSFVGSVQGDPFFEIYSCVDERSAAYMACGMAAESGETVVLSCTGATSSRNYMPALTEAYYRKLPILAVTSSQDFNRIGHMIAQVTDRTAGPRDACVHNEQVDIVKDANDEWHAMIQINKALLALRHNGGGPVVINMATTYSQNFNVKTLPTARLIRRISYKDEFPKLPQGRFAIFVGSHVAWTKELTDAVDRFCTKYGSVVFCDHSSNYKSSFRVCNAMVGAQVDYASASYKSQLLIHIGEITGDYANIGRLGGMTQEVWRINEDGEIRDQFKKLTHIFEMKEEDFFSHYANDVKAIGITNEWLIECKEEYDNVHSALTELPFSNLWIAQQTAHKLPEGSVLHLGILNSLRAWNMFEVPMSVTSYVNTGGFGIDGVMSSCIGGALAQPDRLHFLVIGDLAFFYDLNAIGNRHIAGNLRIILVNNGKGQEFRNYNHRANIFGDDADKYMAAGGHFGRKSTSFVKHIAEDMGFVYYAANNKNEYNLLINRVLPPRIYLQPKRYAACAA